MTFSSLGLSAELVRAVQEQRYDKPTPIQREAIPAILAGQDLLATAQTGTGKTAGFTLPLLQRLAQRPSSTTGFLHVRVLILVPTRELALQVGAAVQTYGLYAPVRSMTLYGGVGIGPQLDALRAGRDIVVATPGRLLDHVSRKSIDLGRVESLVLDEADRMLDMGFIHDIKRIVALLPRRRQNLLFSATFSDSIKQLADRLLDRPRRIDVTARSRAATTIDQIVYRVDRSGKVDLLADLVHRGGWTQVLVFTRTKHGANKLVRKLDRADITTTALHGNKSQSARVRALTDFKDGKVRVLVATDIAARGLDIGGLPHVVNFDLPHVAEDYIHRIGRTGRAGARGNAISLVCTDEEGLLSGIEKLLGRRLPAHGPAGAALAVNANAAPIGQRPRERNTIQAPGKSGRVHQAESRRSRRRKSPAKLPVVTRQPGAAPSL